MPNVTVCTEFEKPSKCIIDRTVFFFPAGRDAILLNMRDPIIERSQIPCGFSHLFTPPVSYLPVLLQSVNCFCSSCLLIASLLASFALVRRLVLLFSLMDLGGVDGK